MRSLLRFCVECMPFLSIFQVVLVSVAQLIAHWTCKLGRNTEERSRGPGFESSCGYKTFLPEAKPTGLVEAMSVRPYVSFISRRHWGDHA